MRVTRLCCHPGCPEVGVDAHAPPGWRCPEHARSDRRPNRSTTNAWNDHRWRRCRDRYIAEHPTCEDSEGCDRKAQCVHHIDRLGPKGPRGLDWSNLDALCWRHHRRRHSRKGVRPYADRG